MTTEEIANQLVSLCREGKFEEVYTNLYSQDILSIEPEGGTWGTVQGMEAIKKKGQEWHTMVEEFHSSEISDPIVAGDFFTCTMKTEISMKGIPERVNMDEVCVYKVENGKVVSEQFFYTPLPAFA
jgi:ketosteroid isomerase-like protein